METLVSEPVEISVLSYGSAAVGRLTNGKAVFVEGAAPGDVVRVELDENKKTFARGHVKELVQAGQTRVAPACPMAGTCGGCDWAHVSYDAQLIAKRANVVAQLVRVGGFDTQVAEALVGKCVPSKRQIGYRNKLELACTRDKTGRLVLGLTRAGSNDVVSIDACLLAHKLIQGAPKALQGALRYIEGTDDLGIFRVGVRGSVRTKSLEVALWTRPGAFPRKAVAKTLASALRATSIVRVLAEPGRARAIKGVEVLSGEGCWREQLGDYDYRVSAPSFFQVNTAAAEVLVSTTLDGLQLDEDSIVADLYSGVGTFTLPMAEISDCVSAVESAGSSVRDLRRNAEDAGVWVDVLGGDSARELAGLGHLDALVVDPPRAGLADSVPADIAAAGPKRMAYVSCDAATWARDVRRLEAQGYALQKVTPVDLFPQTHHCELVSIFYRL